MAEQSLLSSETGQPARRVWRGLAGFFAVTRLLEERVQALEAENERLRREIREKEAGWRAERREMLDRFLSPPGAEERAPQMPESAAASPLWAEADTLDPYARVIERARSAGERETSELRRQIDAEMRREMAELEAVTREMAGQH
jgi:hypothetical protein